MCIMYVRQGVDAQVNVLACQPGAVDPKAVASSYVHSQQQLVPAVLVLQPNPADIAGSAGL
jgi:hypothetical protein